MQVGSGVGKSEKDFRKAKEGGDIGEGLGQVRVPGEVAHGNDEQ